MFVYLIHALANYLRHLKIYWPDTVHIRSYSIFYIYIINIQRSIIYLSIGIKLRNVINVNHRQHVISTTIKSHIFHTSHGFHINNYCREMLIISTTSLIIL